MEKAMNVKILDSWRTEEDLVRTSRVCTSKEEADLPNLGKNIHTLVRQKHWSVFEHGFVTVMIEAPIYVMRQWMRHTGAWMEKSRRYTSDQPEFGSPSDFTNDIKRNYLTDLSLGIRPEVARKCLTLDLMTKVQWTCSLRTLFHFFRLRCDPHAQKEIRELAEQLIVQTYKIYPNVVDAFLTYDMGEFSMDISTVFDLYMLAEHGAYAYENSKKRIDAWGENAKKRLELVKRIFDRIDRETRDSFEDSTGTGDSSTDSAEVPEGERDQSETGTEEGCDPTVDGVREVVGDKQATVAPVSEEDITDQQLLLFNGKKLSVSIKEGSTGSDKGEAVDSPREPNIVEGHFGSKDTGCGFQDS